MGNLNILLLLSKKTENNIDKSTTHSTLTITKSQFENSNPHISRGLWMKLLVLCL